MLVVMQEGAGVRQMLRDGRDMIAGLDHHDLVGGRRTGLRPVPLLPIPRAAERGGQDHDDQKKTLHGINQPDRGVNSKTRPSFDAAAKSPSRRARRASSNFTASAVER